MIIWESFEGGTYTEIPAYLYKWLCNTRNKMGQSPKQQCPKSTPRIYCISTLCSAAVTITNSCLLLLLMFLILLSIIMVVLLVLTCCYCCALDAVYTGNDVTLRCHWCCWLCHRRYRCSHHHCCLHNHCCHSHWLYHWAAVNTSINTAATVSVSEPPLQLFLLIFLLVHLVFAEPTTNFSVYAECAHVFGTVYSSIAIMPCFLGERPLS